MKITKLKVAIVASLLLPVGVVATQFNTQEESRPVVKQQSAKQQVVQEEEPKVQEQPDTEQASEIVNTQPPKITEPQSQPPAEENPYGADSPMGYVYDKRKSIGKSYGKWGMARLWPTVALSQGVPVDTTPQYGDIMVMGDVVYFVESVTEDSINVSTSLGAQVQNISMLKSDLANRPQIRYIH